jgi:radical SAM superfamily enzyme YgiQ (UPF0313 family)
MSNVLLISYDNGSHISFFPINLAYLAGALKKSGHDIVFWTQDIHHGNENELTNLIDNYDLDVVGLGFCAGYWQYEKAKKISEAINRSSARKNVHYVLGGHGPAGDPKFFLQMFGADSVVVGDGEEAICQIAKERQKGVIQGNPSIQDEAPIEIYESWIKPISIYRLIRWPTSNRTDFCFPILSSRGCKWNCSFCYRMREGFYERSIESIIEEIKWLHKHVGITHFQFADELLMSSVKRTEEICESILALPYQIKWDCNGRLNFSQKELLQLMKKSGCEYVNYGIESLNQKILNQMGKGLTVNQIHNGVQASLEAHLSPGLNLLWGFPENTEEDLKEEVKFLKKYDLCHELRTIRPVTPYPGCRLFQKAIEQGLVKDSEDFYEVKHKNSDLFSVNFMDIPTDEAHRMLYQANTELWYNFVAKRSSEMNKDMKRLYVNGDNGFRGFREV